MVSLAKSLVRELFPGSEQSTSDGLIQTGTPLGILLAMFLVPSVLHHTALQITMGLNIVMTALGMLSTIMFSRLVEVFPADVAAAVHGLEGEQPAVEKLDQKPKDALDHNSSLSILGRMAMPLTILLLGYGNILLLRENVGGMLMTTHGLTLAEADSLVAVPVVVLFVMSAPLGWVVDQVGNRPILCAISSLGMGIATRFQLSASMFVRFAAMTVYGAMWGIFQACVWTLFPLLVSDADVDFAFSIAEAGQTLFTALFSFVVGGVLYNSGQYQGALVLEVVCYACTIVGVLTWEWDRRYNNSVLSGVNKVDELDND